MSQKITHLLRFRKLHLQIVLDQIQSPIKLEPLILKIFFEKSIWKLAPDDCYLDVTLRQGPNERESLVSIGAALICPYFPEPWKRVARLKITDSLLLQTHEIGILQAVASNKDIFDQNCKPSPPLSSIPSHTLLLPSKTSYASGNQCPDRSNFHLGFNILINYLSIHAPNRGSMPTNIVCKFHYFYKHQVSGAISL